MSDNPDDAGAPSVYELPSQAIDSWVKLDPTKSLTIPFTRQDLDNLMMGLRQSIVSQMALADALQAASAQDAVKTSEHFQRHLLNVRDAYSNFNRFIAHVMTHAQQEP